MHQYSAQIEWLDHEHTFSTGKYSRAHQWTFDGGIVVEASSSPQVVRLPYSRDDAVDPEEAFVASVSSCHMLTFLFVAWKEKFIVKKYLDRAVGIMEKNEAGQEWISRIDLHPEIDYEGPVPSAQQLKDLHHRAHQDCYIANSIKTAVEVHF